MSTISPPLLYSMIAVGVGAVFFVLALVILAFWAASRRRSLAVLAVLLLPLGTALALGGMIYPLAAMKKLYIDQYWFQLGTLKVLIKVESERLVLAILAQPKYQDPKKLNKYERRVFSQFGEDGIITEIFRRIGTTNRHFVEFGSSDGFECNTTLLLRQGWSGLWMEGSPDSARRAREHFAPEIAANKLSVIETFITAENIEDLFRQGKVPEEFDFLSIDIDRNDYYVWEKITHYRPRVVCMEYNPLYPPPHKWVVPYDGKAWWDGTTRTGASLQSLEELGKAKGYRLVGCSIAGINSFFVREDLIGDHFAAPYTAENHYEPLRNYLYELGQGFSRVP